MNKFNYTYLTKCVVDLKMKWNILSTILFLMCTAKSYGNSKNNLEPLVRTSLGQIKGSMLTSRYGKAIYSFRGVRYAEAPIGALRFKVSQF